MNDGITKKDIAPFVLAGILMLLSELWKQYTLSSIPELKPGLRLWYLPLQLCSVPMYVCLLLPAGLKLEKHGKGVLAEAFLSFLATFGLLSGIFVFFDTSGFYDAGYLPLTVHSYAWHILQILLGLAAFVLLVRRSRGSFAGAAVIFFLTAGIAEVFNLLLSPYGTVNFFYINPLYPMNQKYFREIAQFIGNRAGICLYLAAICLGAGLLYGLLGICSRRYVQKTRQQRQKENTTGSRTGSSKGRKDCR